MEPRALQARLLEAYGVDPLPPEPASALFDPLPLERASAPFATPRASDPPAYVPTIRVAPRRSRS